MAKMIRQRIMVNGQPHWISGKTQQSIVDRAIELHMREHQDQGSKDIPIFGDYVEEWLLCYKQPKLRHSTYLTYRYLLDKHILPYFGEQHLHQVDTAMIQRFYTAKAHLAHSTVNQMGIILKQVFDSAKEDSFILQNPTDSKRLAMSQRRSVREALTAEAFTHISCSLCNLRRQDCLLVALLMFTGIRRGEALGLRWEDIDEPAQIIHIRRSVTFQNNQPIIGSPKSVAGVRIVPLGIQLLSILQPHSAEGYIIGNGVTPMTESAFQRAWERIKNTIDMHGATPHVLRHTYITLASTVIDVKTLQSIAGHADIQTTMNRYAHSQTDKVIEAGRVLESVFHGS